MNHEEPSKDEMDQLFEPEHTLSEEEAREVIERTVAALNRANQKKFDAVDEAAKFLRDEIDRSLVNSIVNRTTPSKSERQSGFVESLPENARRALNNLRLMYGAPSLDEMFHTTTPERMKGMVEEILKLDLSRIWKTYHEA